MSKGPNVGLYRNTLGTLPNFLRWMVAGWGRTLVFGKFASLVFFLSESFNQRPDGPLSKLRHGERGGGVNGYTCYLIQYLTTILTSGQPFDLQRSENEAMLDTAR